MLEVKRVNKSFGGIRAVSDCTLGTKGYRITGLIGPNGSGKTTLFNLITGFLSLDKGEISFKGKRINGYLPHHVAECGMVRTFQLARIFPKMTVLENMLLAPPHQTGERFWSLWLKRNRIQEEERKNLVKALALIDTVGRSHLKDQFAANLSYGQQKLLELARILMAEPEMILLDEPTAGINPFRRGLRQEPGHGRGGGLVSPAVAGAVGGRLGRHTERGRATVWERGRDGMVGLDPRWRSVLAD